MSMQVGESGGEEDTPMSDINTTPLVDVMLVLLIIFLIAVPIVLQSVPMTLPKVEFEVTETKPENVNLSVRAVNGRCEVYWDLTPVNAERALSARLRPSRKSQIAASWAGSRTSPRRICPKRISAATSTRPIAASAARSTRCSARAFCGSASFPSRRRAAASGCDRGETGAILDERKRSPIPNHQNR